MISNSWCSLIYGNSLNALNDANSAELFWIYGVIILLLNDLFSSVQRLCCVRQTRGQLYGIL